VTAFADVLAGYGVAGPPAGADLAWLLGSTACLYAGGIVLNDYFDRHLDAIERPERPIPSGRIRASSAGMGGGALLVLGVLLAGAAAPAAAALAAASALAVLLYDTWGKHQPFAGPVTMGLCRALNLLLGLAAAPAVLASMWPLATLAWTYIAAVTMVSRGEVRGGRKPVAVAAFFLVTSVLAALAGLLGWAISQQGATIGPALGLALLALLTWRVLPAFARGASRPDPATLRTAVRTGVLSLVLLDAVIAAMYADIIYSLAILLTGLAAARLARWFAVT
jgi:4-hydroxybenzoate polyprenyltransferase